MGPRRRDRPSLWTTTGPPGLCISAGGPGGRCRPGEQARQTARSPRVRGVKEAAVTQANRTQLPRSATWEPSAREGVGLAGTHHSQLSNLATQGHARLQQLDRLTPLVVNTHPQTQYAHSTHSCQYSTKSLAEVSPRKARKVQQENVTTRSGRWKNRSDAQSCSERHPEGPTVLHDRRGRQESLAAEIPASARPVPNASFVRTQPLAGSTDAQHSAAR